MREFLPVQSLDLNRTPDRGMKWRQRLVRLLARCAFIVVLFACPTALTAQWGQDIKLSTGETNATTNENMGQCLAVNGNALHVVWCDHTKTDSAIYYKHSNDGGVTWDADTRLSTNPGTADFASIALSGSMVHVAFRDKRTGQNGTYYKRSQDGGNTWDPDFFLGDTKFWPSIAATESMVYIGLNNDIGQNTEVYCVRSVNNGTSWEPMQRISNAPGRSEDQAIAAAGNYVHMAWNDNRTGIMQTFYRRSADKGVTWGPETQLTNSTVFAYMPMLYLFDSNVDAVWADRRNHGAKGNFDIYHLHSTDFGSTWGKEERITDVAANSFYPVIARHGKNVHLVWMGGGLSYQHSSDGGATWEPTTSLVSGTSNPSGAFIAVSGPILHLIWADRRDGHSAIYYKRQE